MLRRNILTFFCLFRIFHAVAQEANLQRLPLAKLAFSETKVSLYFHFDLYYLLINGFFSLTCIYNISVTATFY